MTREDVIGWLEYISDDARSKADGLVPTNIEIACGMAIEALKAQEPRVMTLEEVKRFVYGTPYIIETNLPHDEPRLMYGLYSHQGTNGCFYFSFTDARSHFFDADYGKRWRCWTSRPDEKRRDETPWE